MCLGIPSKVVELGPDGRGKVDYLGTRIQTDFSLMDGIKLGDWVIVHAGFAITRMKDREAKQTLALLREMAQKDRNAV